MADVKWPRLHKTPTVGPRAKNSSQEGYQDADQNADQNASFVDGSTQGRLGDARAPERPPRVTSAGLRGARAWATTAHGEKVPFRAIQLSDTPAGLGGMKNPCVFLNDTLGRCDSEGGLVRRARPSVGAPTQLESAQRGLVTPEMSYVAVRENQNLEAFKVSLLETGNSRLIDKLLPYVEGVALWTPERVRDEVARRRAVIPLNVCHPEAEPMIVGRRFTTKVNANIGSSKGSDWREETKKLAMALQYGADTVMDLSTGKCIPETRQAILRASPVPVGTVPLYEVLERVGGDAMALSWDAFKAVMIEQCEEGVDYMTLHAGLLKAFVPLTRSRMTGIVSRGGGLMARWMMGHKKENFLYTHFDEILMIARRYDVTLSLGDGLRPGSVYDANDAAQLSELKTLGELNRRAGAVGVQCMIEGPGHVPLDLIPENQRLEDDWCDEAPFYTLGPLVCDTGAGYDHVTAAIGGTVMGGAGTAMLCYVTPKEHLGLPNVEDVRSGLVVFRIAAHAADLAKGIPGAILRDHLMSSARFEFRWRDQYALSFDPERAQTYHDETLGGTGGNQAHFCSMCGPQYCPMRLAHEIYQMTED